MPKIRSRWDDGFPPLSALQAWGPDLAHEAILPNTADVHAVLRKLAYCTAFRHDGNSLDISQERLPVQWFRSLQPEVKLYRASQRPREGHRFVRASQRQAWFGCTVVRPCPGVRKPRFSAGATRTRMLHTSFAPGSHTKTD